MATTDASRERADENRRAGLSRLYDYVSSSYDEADRIVRPKQQVALEQIRAHFSGTGAAMRALDLGTGDAAFLALLHETFPEARLTGLDLSPGMLARGRERVAFEGVVSDIANAGQALAGRRFDLVLAHFVLAYVGLDGLFAPARALVQLGGFLSIASTTNESAETLRQQIDALERSLNPFKRIVAGAAKRGIARSRTPQNLAEIDAAGERHGFRRVERGRIEIPIDLADADEAFRFGVQSGMCANALDVPGVPVPVALAGARAALRCFDYPYRGTLVVEVVLMRRDPA